MKMATMMAFVRGLSCCMRVSSGSMRLVNALGREWSRRDVADPATIALLLDLVMIGDACVCPEN
jgi:hypothetical protein